MSSYQRGDGNLSFIEEIQEFIYFLKDKVRNKHGIVFNSKYFDKYQLVQCTSLKINHSALLGQNIGGNRHIWKRVEYLRGNASHYPLFILLGA